jgi:hypothetical protein
MLSSIDMNRLTYLKLEESHLDLVDTEITFDEQAVRKYFRKRIEQLEQQKKEK